MSLEFGAITFWFVGNFDLFDIKKQQISKIVFEITNLKINYAKYCKVVHFFINNN